MILRIWNARNLLFNLVRRDLTVRYRSTLLGFFWSLLRPLAYMGIYHVIFGEVLKIRLREDRIPYALHVLTAVLPWTFFTAGVGEGMHSITSNASIVRKVRLPLAVFPAAAVLAHAVHFSMGLVVIIGVMILLGFAPGVSIFALPVLIAVQTVLMFGVSLLLSAFRVFYRDAASFWEIASAVWFYATPVIYPAYYATEYLSAAAGGGSAGSAAAWIYLCNPMAALVIGYRSILLYAPLGPAPGAVAGGGGWELAGFAGARGAGALTLLAAAGALLALGAGSLVFGRLSRRFADEL